MGSFVSSRLDYINKNPGNATSFGELSHELDHLKKREQMSGLVAVASTILLMVVLAGVLGGGHIIVGALSAVALFAFAYNYFCRLAEGSLRDKQVSTIYLDKKETPPVPAKTSVIPIAAKANGVIDYFLGK